MGVCLHQISKCPPVSKQQWKRGRGGIGEENRRKGKEFDSGSLKGEEGESREDPSRLVRNPKCTRTQTGGRSMWFGGKETGKILDCGI